MKTCLSLLGVNPDEIRRIASRHCEPPTRAQPRLKVSEFEAAALTALRTGHHTAHDIAVVSGMSKTTVALVLASLKRKGLAMQVGTHGGGVARQEWCAIKRSK